MKLIDTLVSILYFKSFQSITKFEGHNGNSAYQKIYIYIFCYKSTKAGPNFTSGLL